MVKKQRAITPPEDANYFTVNNPYPLHFEWEIEEEVIKHARWIVACLGTSEPFWAYHYKKSVPAIILEIAKSKDGVWMKKLLGEHQWQDVLRHPNKDENGCASQIFSCRHQNSLAMINDGWCRVAIQAKWLENWSPEDDFQVNPYPRPTYCEPPHLDRTNLPLSLRLPSKFGPPRPEIAHSKQVPGSNAWVGTQGDRSQINNSPRGGGSRVRGVTRKGSAAAQRPASSGPTWNQPIFESSPQMPITRIPEKLPQARTVKTSTSSSQLPPRSTHHVPANTLSLDNYGPPPGLSQGIVELTESDEELENIVLGSKEHTMQENDSAEYAGLSDEPEVWGGYLVQAKKQTDEPICPVHRRICKRAICSTYDDIIRKRDKQLKKEGKEPLNKVGPYNAKQGEKEFRKRQEAELEKKKEEGKNKQRDLARRRNSSKGTDAAPKRQEKTATLPSGQNDPPAPPPAITSMEDDSEDDPFEDDQPTITEVATHPPTSNRLVWSDEVEKEFGSIHTEDSDESDPEPW